jgi:transcriptional regulator with XRE-family HTH domain
MVLLAEGIMITEMKSKEHTLDGGYIMNTNNQTLMEMPVERNLVLDGKLDRARKSLPYQVEYLKGIHADELWQAMEHRALNQVEFAERAGVTKQFLTKVFRGGNCTIETIVKLAFALNYKVSIHLTPREVGCAWMHCITEASPRPPERFINLWTESGYQPMVIVSKEPEREKIAA